MARAAAAALTTTASPAAAGKGIRNYAHGGVASVKIVDETDDLILISQEGIIIRHARPTTSTSRAAYGSGVRVMRLDEADRLVMVARVDRDNGAETAKPEEEGESEELSRRGDRPHGGGGRRRR